MPSWSRTEKRRAIDASRVEHAIIWTDPETKLIVRCVAIEYLDFPTVEWTVYLRNSGASTTALLENIQGLDTTFSGLKGSEFILNGNRGDYCTAESYQPFQIELGPSAVTNFAPFGYSGKSSDGPTGWPYYNLQVPGGGVIFAIGWPGQWASSFERDAGTALKIKAGQQLTHLVLKPGEEIRTPLIVMLFWKGTDLVRSQNLWRRWYLAHVLPRAEGKPAAPITQIQVIGPSDIHTIQEIIRNTVKPDIGWRDAMTGGQPWYPSSGGPYHGGDSWLNTGTWEVDPGKNPTGFKPLSDWLHEQGMKFLLWFEPERVGNTTNSFLGTNNPEWILPAIGSTAGAILNEGNPDAFKWLTNHIQSIITANGLDWYREDMNGDGPLPAWQNNDATNRQGITENFYVQGHLAYWDALRAMNPRLQIDSCASGGRRNDLETMRRAVPLLRSDFQFPGMSKMVEGNQCHTYQLSSWLPFQGSGCYLNDSYTFRSFYLCGFGMAGEYKPGPWRQAYEECKKVAPILLNGDFYPLTPYTLASTDWMAWQFNRPEKGDGVVQAFRRTQNGEVVRTFRLSGLNPKAQYRLTNFDVSGSTEMSGKRLMEEGLKLECKTKPAALVITYELVK
jgi:alpha-galactosidase